MGVGDGRCSVWIWATPTAALQAQMTVRKPGEGRATGPWLLVLLQDSEAYRQGG